MDRVLLEEALTSVGDRWTLLVVSALLDGPRRFGDLGDAVGGIAPNVLSARLRHLQREGLVVAARYSDRPARFVYELSAPGRDLADALRLLAEWAGRRAGASGGDGGGEVVHGLCGTSLEHRWYCPTCEATVADPDADELRHA